MGGRSADVAVSLICRNYFPTPKQSRKTGLYSFHPKSARMAGEGRGQEPMAGVGQPRLRLPDTGEGRRSAAGRSPSGSPGAATRGAPNSPDPPGAPAPDPPGPGG